MKTVFKLFALLFLFGIICPLSKAVTIEVKNKSCEYSIQIPSEWDTIPADTLNSRFGKGMIDIGLCKKENDAYFDGEYIQYNFLPTIKSLNQFSFKQIATDFKSSISQINRQKGKDSIRLVIQDFNVSVEQKCFYLNGKIKSNSKERRFSQCIIPTKFGFLKIIHFIAIRGDKNESNLSINGIYSKTTISDNYTYTEPSSKSNLTIWHLVLAFGIGLIVYFNIQYAPKIKQLFKKINN